MFLAWTRLDWVGGTVSKEAMWTFSEALLCPGIEVCGDEHQRKQDLNYIVVLLPSKS